MQEDIQDIKNTEENLEQETVQNTEQVEAQKEEESKDELSELKESVSTEKDKYLRLFAEFENYKKRVTKERSELFKTAGQELMSALLPVVDDFDRAMKEVSKSEDKTLVEGVELIQNKFVDTLKGKGLEEIEINSGDAFDTDISEAITQIPAPTEELKGKVVDVVEKGYTLKGKVIRFAKVVVGK